MFQDDLLFIYRGLESLIDRNRHSHQNGFGCGTSYTPSTIIPSDVEVETITLKCQSSTLDLNGRHFPNFLGNGNTGGNGTLRIVPPPPNGLV